MSERRRGRPRDKLLDFYASVFPEVRTRMSLINRRDSSHAGMGILELNTPEGEREFAYLYNNGHVRMSILTELGRYSRRYGISNEEIITLARLICEKKLKAKQVTVLLKRLIHDGIIQGAEGREGS